jgi:hypothetical protein
MRILPGTVRETTNRETVNREATNTERKTNKPCQIPAATSGIPKPRRGEGVAAREKLKP